MLRRLMDLASRHASLIRPTSGDTSPQGPEPPWTQPDPDSGVRVPRPHAPTGLSGSVAVDEPDEDDECLVALGSLHSRKI
jgi:hypothetical protein